MRIRDRIRALPMEQEYDELSASEVRGRMRRGEPWEHLVPEAIVGMVKQVYVIP